MMTPRPTLLIYNAKDDCCFVADTVKENTYDPVVPFYAQANATDSFGYYVNQDPGTHNYERDNRQQFYRFIQTHFSGPDLERGRHSVHGRSADGRGNGRPAASAERNLFVVGGQRRGRSSPS